MNAPDPIDYGVAAMAAALNMSEDEFREAYRRGDVCLPDSVRHGGPRWASLSLVDILAKRFPADLFGPFAGIDAMGEVYRAITRARQVEEAEKEKREWRRGGAT